MAGHCGHNWCFASMRGQFACAIVQMLTVCRIEWAQSQLKDCVFIKYLFNLFLACTQDTAVTEHTSPRHATPPQPCPAHFPDKLKIIKSILAFVYNVKLFTSIFGRYFLMLLFLFLWKIWNKQKAANSALTLLPSPDLGRSLSPWVCCLYDGILVVYVFCRCYLDVILWPSMSFKRRFPTRAFSWLKAPTSAFTFKTLLILNRH